MTFPPRNSIVIKLWVEKNSFNYYDMGYYQDIEARFGMVAVRLLKAWASDDKKLASSNNRLVFLLRCKSRGLLPNHIKQSHKNIISLVTAQDARLTNMALSLNRQVGRQVLKLEIEATNRKIRRLTSSVGSSYVQLMEMLPAHVLEDFRIRRALTYEKVFLSVRRENIKKFDHLLTTSNGVRLFGDNSAWIVNKSTMDIPPEVLDFLSLGPGFAVPGKPRKHEICQFVSELESILDEVDQDTAEVVRAKVATDMTNCIVRNGYQQQGEIERQYERTKRFLRLNPSVCVLKSDKGNATVVIDKIDYISKIQDILNDTNTYKKQARHSLFTLQNKHNNLIKKLVTKNCITSEEGRSLIITNSVYPKLYGLPKIHKQTVPLRPIVACVGGTTYKLAKHLANILTVALADRTEYNVSDSFQFVDAVRDLVLPQGFVIVSFDVVSLFTNIPIELVRRTVTERFEEIEQHSGYSRDMLMEALSFVFDNCYFTYEDVIYRQTQGVPMGNPISPILATLVMDDLLDWVKQRVPFEFPFLYKFVDDIICAIPGDMLGATLQTFNTYHAKLQFTMEEETDRAVPFLDTKVVRAEDQRIRLDWYQKTTASGRYLNFHSNHTMRQKINTIIGMKHRMERISDVEWKIRNLEKLMQLFGNNGYPRGMLRRLLFCETRPQNDELPQAAQEDLVNSTYRKLLSLPGVTDSAIQFLRPLTDVKIVKYNGTKIQGLFKKVKDSTPTDYLSNVVYKIPCLDCEKCYVGQTTQWLKNRITQHKSDAKLNKKSCALAIHTNNEDHRFDFAEAEVLAMDQNRRRRLFKEMYHIKDGDCVNFKTDTGNISCSYRYIFQLLNRRD